MRVRQSDNTTIKVMLIATGGTIVQKHGKDGITVPSSDHVSFKECIQEIRTRLNSFAEQYGETFYIEKIIVEELLDKKGNMLNKDGSNIVPDDWKLIIKKIKDNYEKYDAFIITHGTNTLGYTSSALSFALTNLAKPVILTGAQVSFGYPGSDAQMNLENAIRIAAYKQERLVGVTVVFGSMVITGTRAKKNNEFDYDTFKAFNVSNTIARIGNSVRINEEALKLHRESWPLVEDEFRMKEIASLTEYPGMAHLFSRYLLKMVFKALF